MMTVDPLFATAARFFLGLLLLSTGVHKACHYGRFKAAVTAYRLLPPGVSALAAAGLLAAELTVAGALLSGISLRTAAAAAMALFGLYFAAMAANIARGRTAVDCGCSFSRREAPLSVWHLLRNGVLLSIAALLLPESSMQLARQLTMADGAQVLAALAGLGLLYLSVDGLLTNRGYLVRE